MSSNAAEHKQANLVNLFVKKIHEHPNLQKRAKKKAGLKDNMVIVDSEVQQKHKIKIETEITRNLQAKGIISGFHVVIKRALFEELLQKEKDAEINTDNMEDEKDDGLEDETY